jgi:hypothetical protein
VKRGFNTGVRFLNHPLGVWLEQAELCDLFEVSSVNRFFCFSVATLNSKLEVLKKDFSQELCRLVAIQSASYTQDLQIPVASYEKGKIHFML